MEKASNLLKSEKVFASQPEVGSKTGAGTAAAAAVHGHGHGQGASSSGLLLAKLMTHLRCLLVQLTALSGDTHASSPRQSGVIREMKDLLERDLPNIALIAAADPVNVVGKVQTNTDIYIYIYICVCVNVYCFLP
jgi:hypothetical protein